jgi:hypothetical protein
MTNFDRVCFKGRRSPSLAAVESQQLRRRAQPQGYRGKFIHILFKFIYVLLIFSMIYLFLFYSLFFIYYFINYIIFIIYSLIFINE